MRSIARLDIAKQDRRSRAVIMIYALQIQNIGWTTYICCSSTWQLVFNCEAHKPKASLITLQSSCPTFTAQDVTWCCTLWCNVLFHSQCNGSKTPLLISQLMTYRHTATWAGRPVIIRNVLWGVEIEPMHKFWRNLRTYTRGYVRHAFTLCPRQGLKWDGMGRYGIPLSQSLSHDNTVCERRKERLGNVPFCIWLEV